MAYNKVSKELKSITENVFKKSYELFERKT